jgi:hypothetical protein
MTAEFSRTYNGFSGVAITAWIGDFKHKYADLQAICLTNFRDMAPIYNMGNRPMPPHRGVRGTLIFKKFYHPEPVRVFDIQFRAANEHGKEAMMKLLKAAIWIDRCPWDPRNMYEIDTHYTYIAEASVPWKWTADETACNHPAPFWVL